MAAGEAFALERRFIALGEVPEAAGADFAGEAPGTWLLGHIPWTQARHVIRAVTPPRTEAGLLGVNASAACLELDRTPCRAGRVVPHVRQLFRGDRSDLVPEVNARTCARPTTRAPRPAGLLARRRPPRTAPT